MANTWKGWIIDKSIQDTSILTTLKVIREKVEENTSTGTKNVWTLFTVEVNYEDIDSVAKLLEKQIKQGYYCHFTNGKGLIVVFSGKSFVIRLKSVGEDKGFGITSFEAEPEDIPVWKSAVEYGTTKGKVNPKYILTVR
ncbi:MAG: hypothetical protein ABIA93_05990 [Candidatus Woesearchaeota archaeon]